jgi:DNA-binding response OmpR family regulator
MTMSVPIKKVLVVDDEEPIRALLKGVLEDEGYQVATATNGWECLREVQDFQPDLIILDLDMPHVRGETAINMIRNHDGMRHVPLIVVSGHGSSERLQTLRFFEFGTFFPKPFDVGELLRCVRTSLTSLDPEVLSKLMHSVRGKDVGLSELATTAAGKRCDVYVTDYQGVELRLLVPEELSRLEPSLLAQRRVSLRITVLAHLGTHWKRIWPRPHFHDPKRQLLCLMR